MFTWCLCRWEFSCNDVSLGVCVCVDIGWCGIICLFNLYLRVIWCDLLSAYVPCLLCFGTCGGLLCLACIVMLSCTSACVNMPCLSALILSTDAFRYVCRRLTVLAACTWPSLGFVQPSCWPLRCGCLFICRTAVGEETCVRRLCDLPVPVTFYHAPAHVLP